MISQSPSLSLLSLYLYISLLKLYIVMSISTLHISFDWSSIYPFPISFIVVYSTSQSINLSLLSHALLFFISASFSICRCLFRALRSCLLFSLLSLTPFCLPVIVSLSFCLSVCLSLIPSRSTSFPFHKPFSLHIVSLSALILFLSTKTCPCCHDH